MQKNNQLQNKIAIITGAASGFGLGMTELFVKEGAKVAMLDVNQQLLQQVAGNFPDDSVLPIVCDVSNKSQVDDSIKQAINKFSTINIVVNNAAISHPNQPLLNLDENGFDRLWKVNVKSAFLMTHATVPLLRNNANGGVIINIVSTSATRPRPGLTWYNTTKGALLTFTKSLAVELATDKIRVNSISPVMGETPLMSTFMGGLDTPEIRSKFVSTIPLGRFSLPQDIANAALFLASDNSDMITGIDLPVDGGRCV